MGEEVEADSKRSEAYLVIPTNEVRESIWDIFFFFFPSCLHHCWNQESTVMVNHVFL